MSEVAPEPRPLGENAQRKEVLSDNLAVALHVRLLLGKDALDPDKTDLEPVEGTKLPSQHSETREDTLNRMSAASTVDRADYWQARGIAENEQMNRWVTETVEAYQDPNNAPVIAGLSRLNLGGGINLVNLDGANAARLYERYFADGSTGQVNARYENGSFITIPSNVKKFIDDVAVSYKSNYDQMMADLPAIQFVANMFGETSCELVTQLINAEAKLQNEVKRTELAQNANNEDRMNKVNSEERRLLEFLKVKATQVTPYEGPPTGPIPPTPTPPGPTEPPLKPIPGDTWYYYRPEGLDRYIKADFIQKYTKPETIARGLQATNPQKYGNHDLAQLTREIEKEQNDLRSSINFDALNQIVHSEVNAYAKSIEQDYHLERPIDISMVPIFTISGKTAEFYHPQLHGGRTLASVIPGVPAIFLDFDNIEASARRILSMKQISQQDQVQLNHYFERILREVNPHEFTHLTMDLAYWFRIPKEDVPVKPEDKPDLGKLALAYTVRGRGGLDVGKPSERTEPSWPYPLNVLFPEVGIERGRRLNEALTQEMTAEWVKKGNYSVKIDSYAEERRVLNSMIEKLMREKSIDRKTALGKFIQAAYSPLGYLHLAQDLAGRTVDANGKAHYPSHESIFSYQIASVMMDYEFEKASNVASTNNTPLHCDYNLSLGFVNNQLNQDQKQEIATMINRISKRQYKTYMSPDALEALAKMVGVQVERPPRAGAELPVTLEMAQNGVASFEKVVRKLPAEMQKMVLNDDFLKASFTGTEPAAGEYKNSCIESFDDAQLALFRTALSENAKNMALIDQGKPRLDWRGKPVRSLLNLDATVAIIAKNKSQFIPPAPSQETEWKNWLLSHPEQWWHENPKADKKDKDKTEIRFGLLTGFPIEAALKYRAWVNARTNFEKKVIPTLTKDELTFFVQYQKTDSLPYSDENQKKLKALLDKSGNSLTAQEKELLLARRKRPRGKGTEAFSAFSQADVDYADKLDQLYTQSDMEETIARLKTELHL